jgi:L-ascorbate metabolism protein UlaG (beta-lactamase superfamily)
MKLIPMEFDLDLAVLPIGDNFTMWIEDAIIASDFIECNNILGYHYDTFGYTARSRSNSIGINFIS